MANGLGSEFKSSGVTDKTPGNILFGAGTIHKGLRFENTEAAFHSQKFFQKYIP